MQIRQLQIAQYMHNLVAMSLSMSLTLEQSTRWMDALHSTHLILAQVYQ